MSSDYDEYVAYVTQHEQSLSSYATKTLATEFADGESVEGFYRRTLEGSDTFLKNKYRWRTPFQLDRDSVIYSSLFSRLSEKTQLYTGRGRVENRMTHTLKVAQLTRSICRSLFLNEDLGEAIAVAHDCGHTPYGHIGEDALNSWLAEKLRPKHFQISLTDRTLRAGVLPELQSSFNKFYTSSNDSEEPLFTHGRQSVRLLLFVRKETPDRFFTKHTLFGVWRHSTRCCGGDDRFQYRQSIQGDVVCELDGKQHCSIEAQVVRLADDIAWIISDVSGGLRSRTLLPKQLEKALKDCDVGQTLTVQLMSHVREDSHVGLYTLFVTDLVQETLRRLPSLSGLEGAIEKTKQWVSFSVEMDKVVRALKSTIREVLIQARWVYRGSAINRERILALCNLYYENSEILEEDLSLMRKVPDFPMQTHWYRGKLQDPLIRCLTIADFISVLTDWEVAELSETVPWNLRGGGPIRG